MFKDVEKTVQVLKAGGIILYPTDTVWGIGCDATNEEAVERIFELKNRPGSKAMISLVDSLDTLRKWIKTIPERAEEEIKTSGSPLTVIYDSPVGIADSLKAEDGSAAFRIVSREYTRKICALLGKPLVSTSVNYSGEPAPKNFYEINPVFLEKVDYVCNEGRDLTCGSPSRIIKITDEDEVTVIR